MAKRMEKETAITLRKMGKSYNEIRMQLKVSKSTLSYWLNDYPLSDEQMKKVRDYNPQRIENFRTTMRLKKVARQEKALERVRKDISKMSKREFFIAGFFLYWGEGTKIGRGEVCLANTDPTMVRCFIRWLKILGVSKDKLRIQLSLYKDMDISHEIRYWSKELDVSLHQFRNPYIKESSLIDITYRNGFGHGTCNVRLGNQVFTDYVLMGIRYIRDQYNLTRL